MIEVVDQYGERREVPADAIEGPDQQAQDLE